MNAYRLLNHTPERLVITPIWAEILLISVMSAFVKYINNSSVAGRLTIDTREHVEIVHVDQRPDEQGQFFLVPVHIQVQGMYHYLVVAPASDLVGVPGMAPSHTGQDDGYQLLG